MTTPRLVKLTAAQQRGLLAFDDAGFARTSNHTDADRHIVYWQTVNTLLWHRLIGFETYELTVEGRLMRDVLAVSPRTCRVCGCTDDEACEGGCSWIADDLCSECAS